MATSNKTTAVPAFGEGAETFESGNRMEKSELLGMPHMIYRVVFGKASYGSNAELHCVDKNNKQFYYVDGSTGVYAQLVKAMQEKGKLDTEVTRPDSGEVDFALVIPKGLRSSEYEGPNGRPATTYYFA